MGKLYGCWLEKNFDSSSVEKRIRDSHNEYFPKYLCRVESVSLLAIAFIKITEDSFPNLKGKIHYSYPCLISSIGRYVNDVMHYKLWHDVKITNKAKMIAHTIKWLSHYHVVNTSISEIEYQSLNEIERSFLLELNTLFIANVVRYFLSYFCNGDIPSSKSYSKMFYLIDTGQYDVKTAAVAFDGMIL